MTHVQRWGSWFASDPSNLFLQSFSGKCLRSKGITPQGMYDLEPYESGKARYTQEGLDKWAMMNDVILNLMMISTLHLCVCVCVFKTFTHAPNKKWFSVFIVLMSCVIDSVDIYWGPAGCALSEQALSKAEDLMWMELFLSIQDVIISTGVWQNLSCHSIYLHYLLGWEMLGGYSEKTRINHESWQIVRNQCWHAVYLFSTTCLFNTK